jgi:phenylacetate-CoA ligase
MLSYASSYEALYQSILQNDLKLKDINVSCMISMSETLPDGVRSFLEDYFKTNVVSRYSNMENGFIGQQCLDEKNEYHINTGSFKVEVLKIDEDIPALEGELGRIVITDFFNFGMPMIRYDTGDLGVLSYSKCKIKGPVLSKVEGRKTDFIYNTNGKMLSPHIVTNTMWKYSEIKQFQFIQKTRVFYLLNLNSKLPISSDKIISEFRQFLGEDAIISIEYVDEIPLLASGKRKKVVNEYKPT